MFKIDGTKILLTRGDKCTITLKLKNEEHILNPNDIISFTVYNAFNISTFDFSTIRFLFYTHQAVF